MTAYRIAIATAGGSTTTHTIREHTSIGRSECDIIVGADSVSRQHLSIEPQLDHCVVVDLDSSNGTYVNGTRIDRPTPVRPDDVVALGGSVTLTLSSASDPGASDNLPSRERNNIAVRYIEQSAGRRAAKSVLDSAHRARKQLAGFGNEAAGTKVTIHLIDPLEHNGEWVSTGSIVDVASAQIWCVVSSESRPDDPTRAMALIFGADLAGASELEPLIAGYGLHRAGHHDAAPADWTELEEPVRSQTAAAFVHSLVEQTSDDTVRSFFDTPPEQINARAQELFGKPLGALVQSWIAADSPDYKPGQFMKLALRRLAPYKGRQVEVFAYMLLSLAFSSVYPFVTRHLFDNVIPSQEFDRVWQLLLILIGAFLISLLAGMRRTYQSTFISASVVRDIRQEMFERAQHLSSESMSRYQQGEILSRMFQDVGQLQAGLSAMINTGIFQIVSLVVSGAIMLSVNLWLGLLVCVSAPIIAVVYRTMGEGAQKRSIALQQDRAELMNVASENYQAGPVVRLFRLEGRESSRFRDAGGKVIHSTQRMSLFNGLFGLSVNFIMTVLQMTVLGLGAWLIFQGKFTLGGLVAFLGVMGEFLGPVTELTTLGQTMQMSMGSLKRIEEVTESPVEPAGEDLGELEPLTGAIELRNLSFSYTPERRTLDSLNVTIPAGKRTAFVGPSGSGKSTVLQVLMRLIEPDEGALLLDGVDVRERSLTSLRRQIGVVFQDPFLFNISLAQNIALGADNPSDEHVVAAAAAAEIDSFIDQLPDGLHSPVGEGGSLLSGGQRQRAAIARALIGSPRLLVLDEATSALDSATERQINETIDRAVEGRTVVSVTHRLTAIADYDHIVVLVDGAVEAQGTHDDLLALGGTYTRLWCEQTGAPMPETSPFDPAEPLAQLPLFRTATSQELQELVDGATTVRLGAGSTTASPAGGLAVILSGRAQLVLPTGDTATATTGDVAGTDALLNGSEPTVLHPVDPTDVLMIDAASLAPFLQRHQAAREMQQTLALPNTSKTLVRSTVGPDDSTRATMHLTPSASSTPA